MVSIKEIHIGQKVYHKNIYSGNEQMKVVGIKANLVELEGDYSGGTHNVCQRDWMPLEGLITEAEHNIEKLANYAHKSWSGWMEYLFSKSAKLNDGSVVIPKELVERWERQLATSYSDLPENEKESDRKEARLILQLL